MKRKVVWVSLIVVSLAFAASGIAGAGEARVPLRIGTFDSRAVALAFWRGEEGMEILNGLHEEMAKAKEKGDEKRIAELEVEGPGLQVRLHQQVFSSGSVTDVIKRIEDKLPGIAEAAGVVMIVPKWNVAWQGKEVKAVDVTDEMVRCFGPDENILKMIEGVEKKKPVPIEELSMDPMH